MVERWRIHYNTLRPHSSRSGVPAQPTAKLESYPGGNIAKAYFRPQLPPELEFDGDDFQFQLRSTTKPTSEQGRERRNDR